VSDVDAICSPLVAGHSLIFVLPLILNLRILSGHNRMSFLHPFTMSSTEILPPLLLAISHFVDRELCCCCRSCRSKGCPVNIYGWWHKVWWSQEGAGQYGKKRYSLWTRRHGTGSCNSTVCFTNIVRAFVLVTKHQWCGWDPNVKTKIRIERQRPRLGPGSSRSKPWCS